MMKNKISNKGFPLQGMIILLLLFFVGSCGIFNKSGSEGNENNVDTAATTKYGDGDGTISIDSGNLSDSIIYWNQNEQSVGSSQEEEATTGSDEENNNTDESEPVVGSSQKPLIIQNNKNHNKPTAIKERNGDKAKFQKTKTININYYKVVLGVDTMIDIRKSATMRVWIGADTAKPEFPDKMVTDKKSMTTSITAQSARIIPHAPDFIISPKETKCIIYDPLGSEVQFNLKAKTKGKFDVSAVVELFPTDNCTGAPASKDSKVLTVTVTVNHLHNFWDKLNELGTILWDKFLTFWGALVALFFAFIIYAIKRKLKKKTGFEASDKDDK